MKQVVDEVVVKKSNYNYSYQTLPIKIELGPHGGVCDLYINGKRIENVHSYTIRVEGGKITTLNVEFGLVEGEIEGIIHPAGLTIRDNQGVDHKVEIVKPESYAEDSRVGHGSRAYRRSTTDHYITTEDA